MNSAADSGTHPNSADVLSHLPTLHPMWSATDIPIADCAVPSRLPASRDQPPNPAFMRQSTRGGYHPPHRALKRLAVPLARFRAPSRPSVDRRTEYTRMKPTLTSRPTPALVGATVDLNTTSRELTELLDEVDTLLTRLTDAESTWSQVAHRRGTRASIECAKHAALLGNSAVRSA